MGILKADYAEKGKKVVYFSMGQNLTTTEFGRSQTTAPVLEAIPLTAAITHRRSLPAL